MNRFRQALDDEMPKTVAFRNPFIWLLHTSELFGDGICRFQADVHN